MEISKVIEVIEEVSADAEKHFGNLSAHQLNWKPAPEKWSIAQCLHHLIVSNSTFYPQFREIIEGKQRNSFYQNIKFISRFCGDYLIRETGPVVSKPARNPPVWTPSQSALPASIVADFLAHQQDFLALIRQLEKADLQNIVISSPALSLITYSLNDALIILSGHEQRHLQQAKNVLGNPAFPKGI